MSWAGLYYRAIFTDGLLDLHVASEALARRAALATGRELLTIVGKRAWASPLPKAYYADLLRRMLDHVEVGASLSLAFVLEAGAETRNRYRAKLAPAADAVAAGTPLADALALAGLLDEAAHAMLTAGERGGNGAEVLRVLIARYDESGAVSRLWGSYAIWYAVQYVFALLGALWIRNTLLPDLAQEVADKPAQAAMLVRLTGLTDAYIALVAASLVLIGTATGLFLFGRGVMRARADQVLRRIPGVKALLHDPNLADTLTTAAWGLKAGLRTEHAFQLAGSGSRIPSVGELWKQVQERVLQGKLMGDAFSHNLLTTGDLLKLRAYQNAAQVARTLEVIARGRYEQAKRGAKSAFWLYTALLTGGVGLIVLISVGAMNIAGESLEVNIQRQTTF